MKKLIFALAAHALVAWGCSSDDDDDNNTTQPSLLTAGSDERPSWPFVDFDKYEQNMYVEVQLQDTLLSYASDADLLCATMGGEVRGVAQPLSINGTMIFPLFIGSNEAGDYLSLSYYCERLHRIFTKPEWTRFDPSMVPTGNDEIHQPIFVK